MTTRIPTLWIAAERYARFLEVCADRRRLPATHAEFAAEVDRQIETLLANGLVCVKIEIDPDLLLAWANEIGVETHAKARAQFLIAVAIKADSDGPVGDQR